MNRICAIRRRLFFFLSIMLAFMSLQGCKDIHQFPEIPETIMFRLRLEYKTLMPYWEYYLPSMTRSDFHDEDNVRTEGEIRYVINFQPFDGGDAYNFVRYGDVASGYDTEFELSLPPGEYNVTVWSDFTEESGGLYRFYDSSDASSIRMGTGDYEGCTDYKDAFRGTAHLSLSFDPEDKTVHTTVVEMERPLAKFEFVSTDLEEFISGSGEQDLSSYSVRFYYPAYLPRVFNMTTDRPSDSTTGIWFDGKIESLNSSEVSLGFDYVLVNPGESSINVQIVLMGKDGEALTSSSSISVPLIRGYKTIVKGNFLTQDSESGVRIDTEYDGEYNIFV